MLCADMIACQAQFLRSRMNTPVNSSTIGFSRSFIISFGRIVALAGLLMTSYGASDARAGDVWKEKDYANWTADDVYKIQNESPWTKKVVKDAPWIKGNLGYLSMVPTGCDGRPDYSHKSETPPQAAMGSAVALVEFRVDWMSSKTMRSAKTQQLLLCGTVNKESANDFLDEESELYQIDVKAPDMKPFESMDDETIRINTWLTFKKSQKKINPEYVGVLRSTGQKRIFSITFKFNKKAEDGKDYALPDETEIEFATQADKFVIRTKFQPLKMVVKEGPDL
jgi:hypothetical protein